MHPLQSELLNQAEAVVAKTAVDKSGAGFLWEYKDPEGLGSFYLTEKKTTIHSVFSGKTFTSKPEKSYLQEVKEELKEDAAAAKAKNASEEEIELLERVAEILEKTAVGSPPKTTPYLWKYVDPDSNKPFFTNVRKSTLKSPWSGKSFTAKPEKITVTEVGKELMESASSKTATEGKADWKSVVSSEGSGLTATMAKAYLEGLDRVIASHKASFKGLQETSMELGFLADSSRIASHGELGTLFKKAESKLDQAFESMVTPDLQRLRAFLAKIAEGE